MGATNDIGALHYETDDTPTPASIGALHKQPAAGGGPTVPLFTYHYKIAGGLAIWLLGVFSKQIQQLIS
jgi:hypothetical protein